MIKKKGDFNFDARLKDFKNLKSTMPKLIGNEAKNHFLEGFKRGGGQTDAGNWKRRGGYGVDTGRALLVKSGNLRRSIHVSIATFRKIEIESGLDYSQIHNEGGVIKISNKQRKYFWAMFYETEDDFWKNMALAKQIVIPKREYMGKSKKLQRKIELFIRRQIKKKVL